VTPRKVIGEIQTTAPIESSVAQVAATTLRLQVARLEPAAVRPCSQVSKRQRVVGSRCLAADSAAGSRCQHRGSSTAMRLAARRQSVLRTSRSRDWAPALEARSQSGGHPRRLRLERRRVRYCAAVGLLEPGRKRRGRTTAFWLWSFVGLFAALIVLGLGLSIW
jgi:hypothetical protein